LALHEPWLAPAVVRLSGHHENAAHEPAEPR
jgi:hypothetical protein